MGLAENAVQSAVDKYGGLTAVGAFRVAAAILALEVFGVHAFPTAALEVAAAYVSLSALGLPTWLRRQVQGAAAAPVCPGCRKLMAGKSYACDCGVQAHFP